MWPDGNGEATFRCPTVKKIHPFVMEEEGKVNRVRGIAYPHTCTCTSAYIHSQLSRPYMRQVLLLLTRHHYYLYMLCIKYHMLHSTSRLEIDSCE